MEWKSRFSEFAHLGVFNEKRPHEFERIDYALLAVLNEKPVGYMTIMELDKTTAYLQFGGIFKDYRNTTYAFKAYNSAIQYLLNTYKNLQTFIENTNKPMLKIASKVGFLITGVRVFKTKTLLEHSILQGD